MFVLSNGTKEESYTAFNSVDTGVKTRPLSEDSEEKNLPAEDRFRGFKRAPIVLLPRTDISRYLNSAKSDPKWKIRIKEQNSLPSDFSKLVKNCTVNILRQDLEELKKVNNQSTIMSDLKCKICEKVYSNEKRLQNHQKNKHQIIYKAPNGKTKKRVSFSDHVIVHEVKEYHKCRKCTKIFENYRTLKSHMKEFHKKRNCYICNYCAKKFMDRMFFKVHIKLHCDLCGVLLTNRKKYVDHRQNVCGVGIPNCKERHQCKECNCVFLYTTDLQDHSYEHTGTFYVCDKCKDKFDTKCAVAHHLSYLHLRKKNRPKSLYGMRNLGSERLYLCNFCDESSVERDIIEKHVDKLPDLTNRGMKGQRDYYFCDECLMKFNTEKDMVSHKWTHYLKTSDNSQIRVNDTTSKCKKKITFNINEKIPDYMQPKVMLEPIAFGGNVLTDVINFVDVGNTDFKTAIVDKKSKKTLLSKYQCEICGKYYSSNYCLNRHLASQHSVYRNLQCSTCEETFVWPSLLQTHRCIRLQIPEMPFEDARPEIHFDNINEITQNGFDDLNIVDNDDYMNAVDFEIPAPIVELIEYESVYSSPQLDQNVSKSVDDSKNTVGPHQQVSYKIIAQEVPIEF